MKNNMCFMSLILLGIFQSCQSLNPTKDDIIGVWNSAQGTTFEFKNDGTFVGESLQGKLFFPSRDEFKDKVLDEKGKWDIKEWQGQWVVALDFNKSANFDGGYSTRLLISGEGIFESTPPWHLFIWVDEEGGQRYEFFKKNSSRAFGKKK